MENLSYTAQALLGTIIQNVPETMEQYGQMLVISNAWSIFGWSLLLGIMLWGARFSYKKTRDKDGDYQRDSEGWTVTLIITLVISFLLLLGVLCSIENLLKSIYTPKAFVVDHILQQFRNK